MLANKFDDLLRQRFEEEDPDYNPAAWDALAARIPVVKSNRKLMAIWPVSIGIAASVTGAAAMLFPAQNPQPVRAAAELAASISFSMHKQAGNPPSSTTASYYSLPVLPVDSSLSLSFATAPVARAVISTVLQSPAVQDTNTIAAEPANTATALLSSAVIAAQPKAFNYSLDDEAEPAPAKRIMISLTGGMQYGSLNAGYAAAVNIRHNMGRRWYIDADMGYVMYTASGAQQVTFLNTPASESMPSRPAGNAVAKSTGITIDPSSVNPPVDPDVPPTFRATQRPRIQYIQATPGVGYRVTEHFTIGASVDVQRALIENKGGDPPVEDANGKVLPLMDLGAAGRVQWSITKGLKAGLTYRRGLNTALQGNQSYLDRHYLQFQLIVPVSKR